MLRLNAWGNTGIQYGLPGQGESPRILRKRDGVDCEFDGFGSHEPMWFLLGRFYAVYALDDRFIFQAGRRFWDLTDGPITARFYAIGFGVASGLAIYQSEELIHRSFLFHPGRAIRARLDPTYDFLDAEADNFFLFLRNQIHSDEWRQYVSRLPETAA